MIDYSELLYDPVYRRDRRDGDVHGREYAEVSLTVIDDTRPKASLLDQPICAASGLARLSGFRN